MNKKIISFLSLFSLVLVLSVYYVMLPIKSYVNDDAVNENIHEEMQLIASRNPYFTMLEELRSARHEENISFQLEILASAEYSNEEKITARRLISQEEEVIKLEKDLENCLLELNFNDQFVEKIESTYYVTIYDNTYTNNDDLEKVDQIFMQFLSYFSLNNIEVNSLSNTQIHFYTI